LQLTPTIQSTFTTAWPYPSWIAHRGAGQIAPENTLAAIQTGARHGFRMFEFDVQITADRIPVLLHDATLERTTSGQGLLAATPLAALRGLDAGRWHSSAFVGESVPTLAAVAQWLIAQGLLANIEIKPAPGLEAETGRVVAQEAAVYWANALPLPLLSSFSPLALAAARATAPHLPRALLADLKRWSLTPEELATGTDPFEAILQTAQEQTALAVVLHHAGVDGARIARAHACGLRVLTYTLDDPERAQALLALGLDGVITDAVDRMGPACTAGVLV
jgi:glycerophosphoryl diester phosphodiesterase